MEGGPGQEPAAVECWVSLRSTAAGRAQGRPRTHLRRCRWWYVAAIAKTLARVRPVAVMEMRLCRDCGRTTW